MQLSSLLSDAREGKRADSGRGRLDELMAIYRRGLVQKARAWRKAVARGLKASVMDVEANGDHAA